MPDIVRYRIDVIRDGDRWGAVVRALDRLDHVVEESWTESRLAFADALALGLDEARNGAIRRLLPD